MIVHADILHDRRAVGRRLVALHDVDLENARDAHFEVDPAAMVKTQVPILMANYKIYQSGLERTRPPTYNTCSQKPTGIWPLANAHPNGSCYAPHQTFILKDADRVLDLDHDPSLSLKHSGK